MSSRFGDALAAADTQQGAVSRFGDPAAGGGQDSSVVGDFVKGAWSKLNPLEMIKGMGDTAKALGEHPIDTALSVLAHPYNALKRAKEAIDAGKPEEAAAHVQAALSPVGFMTEDSAVKAATPGKRAEGFGELLGTGLASYLGAKGPEITDAVSSAVPKVTQFASKVATNPHVLKGGGAAAGAAIGHATGIPGAGYVGGFLGREAGAALADKLSNVAEVAPHPVPESPPALPATPPALPAAAVPDTASLDDIARSLGGKPFSKLGPAGQEAVRKFAARVQETAASDAAKAQAAPTVVKTAAALDAPSPVDTSAVKVIPFSKETPSAEVFKAQVRADRAPKVELMARHLSDSGITPEQIDSIPPGKWRDIADALKIDLPKSLDSTIRDVKARVGELGSTKTAIMPSPALQEALKKPGAMEAARKLAEAMK